MERLDEKYAILKKTSKDPTLGEKERAEAAEQLAEREATLMPTYKQIALLYADLHE